MEASRRSIKKSPPITAPARHSSGSDQTFAAGVFSDDPDVSALAHLSARTSRAINRNSDVFDYWAVLCLKSHHGDG